MNHVDYPHHPGQLFDCPACESGDCVCVPATDAGCVSDACIMSGE